MSDMTPQEMGYAWDRELGKLIGGEHHIGSGNRAFRKLDASGNTMIVSGKHTIHESFSVKETDLDEAVRAALGPEAVRPDVIPILAVKFVSGRKVAVIDLDQLLDWIRQPPQLVPATKQDSLRATARTPPWQRD